MSKGKKQKYVPLVGITGEGEDYNIYNLSPIEKITGFAIGFAGGTAAMQVMFSNIIASIIIGIGIGIYAIPIYRNYLQKKRKRTMLIQFRDLLDSLSNSFSSGKNTMEAFSDAYDDMKMAYGDKAPLVKELLIIINGMRNGCIIEDLLKDMAKRCGIDDIASFAETFSTCNRLGGNLKKIVSNTRDIINDKIEIEMEIQTTITSNKNEINIMSIMPFVIIPMMSILGQDTITGNSIGNIVVKVIALAMFAIAYKLGKKITDIQV